MKVDIRRLVEFKRVSNEKVVVLLKISIGRSFSVLSFLEEAQKKCEFHWGLRIITKVLLVDACPIRSVVTGYG